MRPARLRIRARLTSTGPALLSAAAFAPLRALEDGDALLQGPRERALEELVARVRALLRRGAASESTKLKYGDVEMDLAKRTVRRGDDRIKLTAKEFALLEFLIRNPDRVLSRSVITEKVWDMNYEPTSNVVDVYVGYLRKKLEANDQPRILHTRRGQGYILTETPQGS